MAVLFNHSILAARDRHESARFLAEILDLPEPTSWGPFTSVELGGGVTIQFAEPPVDEIQMQHYAFLVDDEDFDGILERVQARGLEIQADPAGQRKGEINTEHHGRGFYFFDPAGHGLEVITRPYGFEG
jgi:catechol 2,3-dioxygenase-like lactoylglutathione lyase family enzyme